MFQYTPVPSAAAKPKGLPQRNVNRREHERVLSWLEEFQIEEGFVQDPATNDAWLPDFTRPNPFPAGQAVPVWHFERGYLD
jgi:putative pyruvate formate lyase activating enzyme